MFCSNCGNQIPDGARFCGKCGTPVEMPQQQQPVQPQPEAQPQAQVQSEQPVYQQPVYQQPIYQQQTYQQNVYQQESVVDPFYQDMINSAAGSALTWGILSLVFACTFYLSFLGIIFACVAFSKANNYKRLNNNILSGKAKVGRGLALGGLIAGIVMTFILFLFVIVIGEATSEVYDYYEDFYDYSLSVFKSIF